MITGQVARSMILKQVGLELKKYLHEKKAGKDHEMRLCTCGCGTKYTPRHGFHFLATDDCRRRWRRGWFRPRKHD